MASYIVVDNYGAPLAKVKADSYEQAESLALRTIVGAHHVLEAKSLMHDDIEKRLIEQFTALGLSPSYAQMEARRTNVNTLLTYEAPAADPNKHLSEEDRKMAEAFRALGMSEDKVRIAVRGRDLT